MTNTYHNNGSGGTAFTNKPSPPIERVDRPPKREVSADA